MWIRKLPNNYQEHTSFCYGSVMLWQNKKVYVMDNHLSAAWCWLQRCNPKKKYNFMHIDRHHDMLECFDDADLQPLRDNPRMTYDEFKNLKRSHNIGGEKLDVFRWDNYIMAAYTLQPNWFRTNIFLTQKEDGPIEDSERRKTFHMKEKDPLLMDFFINQYINEPHETLDVFEKGDSILPWIVNLDLDVFYTIHSPHIQLYSNEYIRYISKLLNENMPNIHVLTIALSPDCIGGDNMKEQWANSFRILKIMSEEVELLKKFPFPNHQIVKS